MLCIIIFTRKSVKDGKLAIFLKFTKFFYSACIKDFYWAWSALAARSSSM